MLSLLSVNLARFNRARNSGHNTVNPRLRLRIQVSFKKRQSIYRPRAAPATSEDIGRNFHAGLAFGMETKRAGRAESGREIFQAIHFVSFPPGAV